MKLKERMTVEEVLETYLNGNISDAKIHVRRMSKSEFMDFLEIAYPAGVTQAQIHRLLEAV